MGFSRQEYLSELLFLSPGYLSNPGIKPHLLHWQVDSLPLTEPVKNLPAMQDTWVQPLDQEDPLEKGMTTPPVSLPRESHGQRA